MGYFTARRRGDDVFTSDALVFLYPSREVPLHFRTQLSDYVRLGGKVLIVDSPANSGSTANALLHPFGMSVLTEPSLSGSLETPQGWPSGVTVETAGGTESVATETFVNAAGPWVEAVRRLSS